MTSHKERTQEMHERDSIEREGDIRALEETMMEWVEGKRSHWNYYSSAVSNPADASALCSIADAMEVQKLAAAIMALRAGQ